MRYATRSATARQRAPTAARCAILVYHRVATAQSDPLGLNVTPAHLAEQLEVIASEWRPLSLTDLTDTAGEHGMPAAGSLAVTFDDGYAGLEHHALTLLARYGVPATAFIVSGFVGGEFWWERLDAAVRRGPDLPAHLDLELGGRRLRWSRDRVRLRRRSIAPRDELFYTLCRRLRNLAPGDRGRVLAQLAACSGAGGELEADQRPLSAEGLRRVAASGIVEIGGHTMTHPVLARLTAAEQYRECAGAKAALDALIGGEVTSFAYPYGGRTEYDASAVAAVRRAGYHRACANTQRPLGPGADVFELPRLIVGDWDGARFARRLEQWLGHPSGTRVAGPA